jgi:hypothetical protein
MTTRTSLAGVLVVLAIGALGALRAAAEVSKPVVARAVVPSPSRIDAGKIALARPLPPPPLAERGNEPQASAPQVAAIADDDWETVRSRLATLLQRPVASLPATQTDAANLTAPGNRIWVSVRAIPNNVAIRAYGGNLEMLANSANGAICGHQGTHVKISFAATPGGAYLFSCSAVRDTDYVFYATTPDGFDTYGGHAQAQANGSAQFVVTAPPVMQRGNFASVELSPALLPEASLLCRVCFEGCDIVRIL